ncbi:RDD family protein [Williamsia sp. Leaf354]|uniref:RDD family protein n=1 Tax=Williamsia sp. Leaf354 TaxID=1736349 RepID=UPI000AAE9FC8|nr:RDD family protein [Williamsia sp. Leaf354]
MTAALKPSGRAVTKEFPITDIPEAQLLGEQPIASVRARLTAAAIDIALFLAAFFATGLVTIFVAATSGGDIAWAWPIQMTVPALFGFTNLAVLQGHRGTSLGKATQGIAVVDDIDGRPIGVPRGATRLALHVLVDPIALIGPILMLADPVERRTVADRVCRSVVVSTR